MYYVIRYARDSRAIIAAGYIGGGYKMNVEIGDVWLVFGCPECDEVMSVADINDTKDEAELECKNGHAWIVSTAFG